MADGHAGGGSFYGPVDKGPAAHGHGPVRLRKTVTFADLCDTHTIQSARSGVAECFGCCGLLGEWFRKRRQGRQRRRRRSQTQMEWRKVRVN